MTFVVTFSVPGQPQGKGRPRISKAGSHARMYTPAKTVSYEGMVALTAAQAMGSSPPLSGPANVALEVNCEIPASWSQKKQRQAISGEIRPTTKPDVDNVVKAIFDGMNGVVWRDDVQAVGLVVHKRYSVNPRVNVIVSEHVFKEQA